MSELNINEFDLGISINEGIAALGILAVSVLAVLVISLVLKRLVKKDGSGLKGRLVDSISRPVLLLVLIQGIMISTTVIESLDDFFIFNQLSSIWAVIVIALLAVILVRSVRASLTWYGSYVAPQDKTGPIDSRLVGPLRRFLTLIIYALAGMLILDQLNISISPLIAGLGIGGLAVALALQPTLSNFFAGTYLFSDKVVSPGDFIELENGLLGYVSEIGWRSTRIRLHSTIW